MVIGVVYVIALRCVSTAPGAINPRLLRRKTARCSWENCLVVIVSRLIIGNLCASAGKKDES